jgi:hypothetical protein
LIKSIIGLRRQVPCFQLSDHPAHPDQTNCFLYRFCSEWSGPQRFNGESPQYLPPGSLPRRERNAGCQPAFEAAKCQFEMVKLSISNSFKFIETVTIAIYVNQALRRYSL